MLFYYLTLLQSDCLVTPQCMQFDFGDTREVYHKYSTKPLLCNRHLSSEKQYKIQAEIHQN